VYLYSGALEDPCRNGFIEVLSINFIEYFMRILFLTNDSLVLLIDGISILLVRDWVRNYILASIAKEKRKTKSDRDSTCVCAIIP
jgi:hypothetical protein